MFWVMKHFRRILDISLGYDESLKPNKGKVSETKENHLSEIENHSTTDLFIENIGKNTHEQNHQER